LRNSLRDIPFSSFSLSMLKERTSLYFKFLWPIQLVVCFFVVTLLSYPLALAFHCLFTHTTLR
jgi:hypothetical protein